MQGWHRMISTDEKVAYLNALLRVGFDTIDFGSFVSPKFIPQMADTREVLPRLQLTGSSSKLLAIVANVRGLKMQWHLMKSAISDILFLFPKLFS